MDSLLPALAFAVLIAAQFVAVVAVHERDCDERARGRPRAVDRARAGNAVPAGSSPRP